MNNQEIKRLISIPFQEGTLYPYSENTYEYYANGLLSKKAYTPISSMAAHEDKTTFLYKYTFE